MRKRLSDIVFLSLLMVTCAQAQVTFTGSIQHDGLFPTDGENHQRASWAKIDHLSNTYVDLGLRYVDTVQNRLGFKGVNADTRLELTEWPMPGYKDLDTKHDFRGHGVSRLSLEGQFKWGSVAVGDVYGQFGSGLILRLYEERSLGIDNSLRGGKIVVRPYRGVHLEALGGKQRVFWNCYDKGNAWNWNYAKGAVVGANAEVQVDELSKAMLEHETRLMVGGSWVSKYEPDELILTQDGQQRYNLPLWVGAWDACTRLDVHDWSLLVEYARKANDPYMVNDYSYKPGEALLLSLSYSRRGLSVLAQAKRSENMYFRSERNMDRTNPISINHLPAFTYTHTYALAAFRPYATQMDGEWAFQGEVRYTAKRHTGFGGRYGTTLKVNASHVRGLSDGWFQTGKTYYTDVNLELNKKLSKAWYLNAMLLYQQYNEAKIEGHGEMIHSLIGVADGKVRISPKVTLRAELQYLYSRQAEGQWCYALCELSLFNQLMLSVSDEYCIGHGTYDRSSDPTVRADSEQNEHYYMFNATWTHDAHRLSLGYGRTVAGYNCSGGVCRYVPEQKGVTLSYNYTF